MKDKIAVKPPGATSAWPAAEQLIDSDQLAPRNVAGRAAPPPRDEISSLQGTHGGAADLSRYLAMLSRGQKKSAE